MILHRVQLNNDQKNLKFGFMLDWIAGATEQKKLLN